MIAAALRAGIVAAVASVAFASGAFAQRSDVARIPARLTLDEALRLARTHNPTFLQTRNDIEVAEAQVRSAWGAFLPNLNTSMGLSGGRTHVVTYSDPVTGEPQELAEPNTSTGSGISQGINMSLTLFDGGRMFRNLDAQKANVLVSEASIVEQENTLNSSVRTEFFLALRAEEGIVLSEALLASAQDRLTQTEALFRTAAKGQVDLLGAREEIATQQMDLQRAKDDATKARLSLAQAIGIRSDGSFAVEGALPTVFDPARIAVDSLLALAARANPGLRRQEMSVLVAEKQASAAKGIRLPTISTNFNYGRSVSVPEFGAFTNAYKYLNPKNSSLGFGLSLSLPVFSRFGTSAAIIGARATADDARYRLAQTRLQLETDVRTAYIDFMNAYQSLQLAETKAALSEERLALSQDQYRGGSITFSELQLMIDRAANAQRDALSARFVWITSLIALELKVGAPVVQ